MTRIHARVLNRPYVLSGFACLRREGPAFLIPYFAPNRNSDINQASDFFVQELDEGFKISRFRRFKPEHYYPIDPEHDRPTFLTRDFTVRKVGEVGLLAYRNESGHVSFGGPMDLKTALKTRDRPKDRATFFNLGVSVFLKDRTRIEEAINLIGDKMADPAERHRWVEIQRAILLDRPLPPPPPDPSDRLLIVFYWGGLCIASALSALVVWKFYFEFYFVWQWHLPLVIQGQAASFLSYVGAVLLLNELIRILRKQIREARH